MFQLAKEEYEPLISQNAISKTGRGGRRFLPYVSTEHGAIMAANILNSERAIEASIDVVRAFVRLRELLATNKDRARKLSESERRLEGQDAAIHNLFEAIRRLLNQPEPKSKKIGFPVREGRAR